MIYRIIIAAVLSLGTVLITGPKLIEKLKKLHFGQTIYELGPAHQQKQGTPVMGGLMMALGATAAAVLCHPLPWNGAWDILFPLLGLSLLSMSVGFADDWVKAVKKRHEGLTPWQKIAGQVIVAAAFTLYCYFHPQIGSRIRIPFTQAEWDLGIFYIPIMILAVIFAVNSSNLQDGLDGLLSTVPFTGAGAWALICVLSIMTAAAGKETAGPAAVFAAAVMGACLGFLRFNRYPAKIFMGDTGSMFLGGACTAVALVMRQPLLLILTGFCPLMSSVSVIMQRYYYKLTHGKRIFLMSPVHHHFEKKGYSETQIVAMYATITTILSFAAVLSIIAAAV